MLYIDRTRIVKRAVSEHDEWKIAARRERRRDSARRKCSRSQHRGAEDAGKMLTQKVRTGAWTLGVTLYGSLADLL